MSHIGLNVAVGYPRFIQDGPLFHLSEQTPFASAILRLDIYFDRVIELERFEGIVATRRTYPDVAIDRKGDLTGLVDRCLNSLGLGDVNRIVIYAGRA
ncbi:hypothetical protein WJ07_19305 [Burkholderia vietnamiensis]|uniref:hypothetical protein n=1 Tax=Burkholderia vietnamiensis TaxID=60552 RepID=UPI000756482C|nr:hypothetical protein [Burkholderia vietnamiensis]KVF21187.1 hypothetical protein WJ07_19305 [Burkholderia vietnamiensis]